MFRVCCSSWFVVFGAFMARLLSHLGCACVAAGVYRAYDVKLYSAWRVFDVDSRRIE